MLSSLPLTFRGELGQQALPAELAPEAKLSAIHPAWLPGLAVPTDLGHWRDCRGQRPPTITHAVRLEFEVSGEWFSDEFFVVPDFAVRCGPGRADHPQVGHWARRGARNGVGESGPHEVAARRATARLGSV